jgi:hypothetical protein
MKKQPIRLIAFVCSVLLFSAFTVQNGGVLKGTVLPAESATRAFIISGTDTIQSTITAGSFEFKQVKAGTYQLTIEATAPYQHKTMADIAVKDGETTDVGAIQLEKK